MAESVARILFLVEGEKMEPKIMRHVLSVYGLGEKYEIISYKTNIYGLYEIMFAEGHPEDWDLLQIMKERANESESDIFNYRYSDMVLIFDLDPQHPGFSVKKIREMAAYFVESSDMGKLYINYPMVEAFYHMKSVPDMEYNSYEIAAEDVYKRGRYKSCVKKLCGCSSFDNFFRRVERKEQCGVLIRQNLDKAKILTHVDLDGRDVPEQTHILDAELRYLENEEKIKVLCTCVFFIADYNYAWVSEAEL